MKKIEANENQPHDFFYFRSAFSVLIDSGLYEENCRI